ncbi:MAG: flagellin [Phycisphaeraceae bacterium]|nr:flagellin [Phycisphaeraceae bacterium]
MSRINTNVQSLLAQRILGQQNHDLTKSLERLSTGLRINRGADDPAGLIASEALRSEKASLSAAIGNAERADQVINIAEGGLQEINSLLVEIQSLVTESANSAGLSLEEKKANQLQIDSILQSIDRISAATSFQGSKLLNGTYDFTITNQATTIDDFDINAAKLSSNETRAVQVVVTASAQHGSLFLSAAPGAATALDFGGNAAERFVFEIAGSKGSREFSFASGTTLANVATGINTFKEVTGVSAVVSATAGGGYVKFRSTEFGSDHFVSFKLVDRAGGNYNAGLEAGATADEDAQSGTATTLANATNAIRDTGQDVSAIINGILSTANGKVARINTDFLDVSVELTNAGAQALGSIAAFTITGGGAKFNLGPSVDITNQASIGVQNVAARNLGDVTSGYLDDLGTGKLNNVVDGNLETGQKIVDNAIAQISDLRGRLGAFQKNIVGASIRSLGVALENTSAAESSIRDTDFAEETATLTRSQILVQAATNVLAIANAQPQSVLALLG